MSSTEGESSPRGRGPADAPDAEAPEPVLPERSTDDRDLGWGEDLRDAEADPDDVRRFLDERPPHHG